MVDTTNQRRLAAILASDVASYTRLVEEDTDATVAAWKAARTNIIEPGIARYSGRIVKLTGDGFLAEFPVVQDAVKCAIAMQQELEDGSLDFRMGVNLGDIVDDGQDIHGEGVNIAARIEALADNGGICISGMVYESVRNRLDHAFEDMGAHEVKHVTAPVQVYRVVMDDSVKSVSSGLARPDKPTVAVLPFDNMSSNDDQEYFASGMTEDIITALTKYRWLSVTARNSTAAYKGHSLDVRQIAKELGADYVIEGSVRKMGKRLRVTAQLIDAATGKHIWAERYDRDLADIFVVQDEITETITATIEPEMATVEGQRARQKPTQSLDAWDCYHLGLSKLYRFSLESNQEAQQLFRRAIEIDPNFGAVYARLAHAMALSAFYFDADPTPEFLDEALRSAKRAAEFDGQDAGTLFVLGRVYLARGEYDLSIAELQNAIDLNPCFAQAHCGLGDALACAGQPDESVSSFDEAIRLSPHDPYMWGFQTYGAMARLFMKQHEAAAQWARDAVRLPNSHFWANAILVAILGHLDRPEETRAAVTELLRRKPEFSCQFARKHLFYIKVPAQMDHYIAGLRNAGVPE